MSIQGQEARCCQRGAVGGVCPRGVLLVTPPMLHVWMIEQPCGPFAGIESLNGGACGTHGH